ncbi:4Fe-4S dicluster domain-containing protein [Kordiimonas aquimaris]|uniref:4Fe-4S dicluster domain-containing protein n=1 Tax=Kordiimonas aquimaris TaxID=707591 RepID=UPI0029433494|nr:4Fe-4S dicluster domain-containing protein [Kordiimonas aquimaris]
MTSLPKSTDKKLGLVIDLDICVGCQACAVSCKEWNTGGAAGPMEDRDAYGMEPEGVWFNRVHSYEVEDLTGVDNLGIGQLENSGGCGANGSTVHMPKSCLHCEDAPCVTVCPTGASYKREEDGIVLVNPDTCIGCKLCSWACPYGAREYDLTAGVMKKCTLCVDRIYDDSIPEDRRVPACVSACPTGARAFGDLGDPDSIVSQKVAKRETLDLMPSQGTKPVNAYLAPRKRNARTSTWTPKFDGLKSMITRLTGKQSNAADKAEQ